VEKASLLRKITGNDAVGADQGIGKIL